MKRMIGIGALLMSACLSVFGQVDTTYIYNPSMPYGTLDLRIAKSSTRYYYLQEDVTFSYRETSPGVRSTTYRDMTSWDSSPYKQGNLREKNGSQDLFVMNYRIMFPQNYQPEYDPGYPIIIMFHGAGEAGNCWGNNCHWSTRSWDPNRNEPPAPSTMLELLNNDRNLFHGGEFHMKAVKAAGSKLPDDPSLPANAFPGFVLFPQSLNGWLQPAKVEDALRILRLIIKKYNIDENRVYVHGLSNGGAGVNQALKRAPWMFASSATMSAISDGEIALHNQLEEAKKIPMRIFQGGQDNNPTPSRTYSFIKKLRDVGAVVHYYLYPSLGHGTWNTAYKEPDFFPWFLSQRKYNPHVSYGNAVICNTTGAGVKIGFSRGFLAYQWEKNGQIISGETDAELVANEPGTYRGRFSRKSANPSDGEWEPWSDPIEVTEINPAKPKITVTGTTHLRGPGLSSSEANNTVVLSASQPADLYNWYRNGQPVNFTHTDIDDTLQVAKISTGSTASNGAYTLVIRNSYCPSPPSDPVYLFFNNSAPVNISLNTATVNFRGTATSSTVFLTWNDVVTNETGYEIWRRKSGTSDFRFVTKTGKDAISYLDSGLEPSTQYEYKLRAINNTGRSNYAPSDNVSTNYQITTTGDASRPGPPQNLKVVSNDINSITFTWEKSDDDVGIKEYIITFSDRTVVVPGNVTTYTVTNLPSNREYAVTVVAKDHANHLSEPSNQVIATTYILSLTYKHSTGAWTDLDDSTLVKTFIVPEFTGTISNFSLAPRTQEDFYNFQYTGYLNVAADGNYRFRITSDDGSRLILNDSMLIDNDGKHGNRTVTSDTIYLTAGLHAIEVQYFDNNGYHNLVVQYAGPGIGDGVSFVNIPDEALRSGNYTPPVPPAAPGTPAASSAGLQSISLSWQEPGETDVEIYRATSEDGPYQMVGRAEGSEWIDSLYLQPGTKYYYKIRGVNENGTSGFSGVVSATTASDNSAPTAPQNLELRSKTSSSIALAWAASTDNIGVVRYEIFANGESAGTSTVNSFTVTQTTGITYTFTVKAYDASGNASELSQALVVDNTVPGMYFSLATGNLNELSTWKKNADGTGASPENFTADNQTFVLRNRTSTGIGGDWSITGANSRIIVPENTTLTIDYACACAVELQGNAVLNLDDALMPKLTSVSEQSTISFNAVSSVPKGSYGHVILNGEGEKTFEGDTVVVQGNLAVNGTITMKGIAGTANVKVFGDLAINNNDGATYHDVHMVFSANTLHNVQVDHDLRLHAITEKSGANVILTSSGDISLFVGAASGGGLTLANGSVLDVGANNIFVRESGAINPQNQKGQVSIGGGDLIIRTSAALSNLYFHPDVHSLRYLEAALQGGVVKVNNKVDVSEAIVVTNGEINSGGNIRLLSNETMTARILPLVDGGKITGAVTVQHYLPLSGKSWKDLTSPVAGASVADWQKFFPITGSFTGASKGGGLPNDPSMFRSNGQLQGLEAFPPSGSSNAAVLEKGKGYSVYMYAKNDSTATVTELSGIPHQGNISLPLSAGNGNADMGWNLVGNPYASPILWAAGEGVEMNNVSPIIAIRESFEQDSATISKYTYVDANAGGVIIPAGKAFWVQAIAASPSIVVREQAKADGTPSQQGISNRFMNIALRASELEDITTIRFAPEATTSFDPGLDAAKFTNQGMFGIASISDDDIDLAVNTVNDEASCMMTLGLRVSDLKPGSYVLAIAGSQDVATGSVKIHDRFTQTTAPLSSDYAFTVTSDPASAQSDRFTLEFSTLAAEITMSGDTLYVQADGQYQWKKNGVDIPGATQDYLVPRDSGSYTVVVTSGSCVVESGTFMFNGPVTVGNEPGIDNGFDLEIFPVPSNGSNVTLRLLSAQPGDVALTIYSSGGQQIFAEMVPAENLLEGLPFKRFESLSEGVYIVSATQGKRKVRKRMIIRH